jgi:hypothetical protein
MGEIAYIVECEVVYNDNRTETPIARIYLLVR